MARQKTFLQLDQILLGNKLNDPVVIFAYNPRYPTLYLKEAKLIRGVLNRKINAVEHIGSTAVPNLGGKNIIDIMAGVNSGDEADECLPPLDRIGYKDVIPQPNNSEWFYCLGKRQQDARYHLHLVKFDSEHWKRHLAFRDFLRQNPRVCQEYYNLKVELAEKYETDRLGYTEAKTAFIESILENASTLEK